MRPYLFSLIISFSLLLLVNATDASILYSVPLDPPYEVKDVEWSYGSEDTGGEEARLLYRGNTYFKEAMLDPGKDNRLFMKALNSYRESIRRYPDSKDVPAVIIEIGKIYMEMGLFAEAKGTFKRALEEYPSTEYTKDARYYTALVYEKEGNYNDALDEYRILSMNHTGDMEKEGVFGMARVFFTLHEFGQAKRLYEGGLLKWPSYVKTHPEILFNYSECQFQNGEFLDARDGFLIFYNIFPDEKKAGFALTRVGETYLIEQKTGVAEKIYGYVIDMFPDSEEAYLSKLAIGDIKFLKAGGELAYDEAARIYREVEDSSGNEQLSLKARYRIGKVYEVERNYKEALSIYDDLLDKTDPVPDREISASFKRLVERLGRGMEEKLGRQDYPGAVKDYQTYYKQFIDRITDEKLLMDIAAAHKTVHLYDDAYEIYQEIIKRGGPNGEIALFKAGELYYYSGDYMKAAGVFGRYTADYPKGKRAINARALLGESLYRVKDYEKAANSFYAVIREAPYQYPDVYVKLSSILLGTGQYEGSVNILTDIIGHLQGRRDGDLPSSAYIALGDAYYGMERYQDALSAYRSGLDKAGLDKAGLDKGGVKEGTEMVQFMVGDCLLRLNKKDEAMEIFTRLSRKSAGIVKEYSDEKLKDLEMNISGFLLEFTPY